MLLAGNDEVLGATYSELLLATDDDGTADELELATGVVYTLDEVLGVTTIEVLVDVEYRVDVETLGVTTGLL